MFKKQFLTALMTALYPQ